MQAATASIITIGDELLIGQVIDTNSAWIAQELNKAGIWLTRRVAVGDVWQDIWRALDEEKQHADVILITGGLGPTADDITKPLLCQYFGGTLVTNAEALENIRHIFTTLLKRPILDVNLKQAEVPDTCIPLQNANGTAPGMWFEENNKIFVSMPGVPHEMKAMMQSIVLPRLQERLLVQPIIHRTLLVTGIGESFLAEKIKSVEEALPSYIRLAYLPNLGMVRLRLSATGANPEAIHTTLDDITAKLRTLLQGHLIAEEDIPLEVLVGRMLAQQHKTVATAESCTGGYIAHLLTAHAKSSAFFSGSVVCYHRKVKEEVLQVDSKLIRDEGTVNKEVAVQMCRGVLALLHTDYAIAVTGLMGPDAGDEPVPVGTVWIAAGSAEHIEAQEFFFRFDRRRNLELTAVAALNKLRQFILQHG